MTSLRFKWITISIVIILSLGTVANAFLYSQKSGELANLQSKVNKLEDGVGRLSTASSEGISKLAGNVSILVNDVSKLADNISTLEQGVSKLPTRFSTLDDKTSSILEQTRVLAEQTTALSREIAGFRGQTRAIIDSIDRVMPSVVYIQSYIGGQAPGRILSVSGSGVILSPDGYILTNKHVVQDASQVHVILHDRRVFQASGVWMDDILDLAVVKIEDQNVPSARFGDPSTIAIGEAVIALGFPLGLAPREGGAAATAGIVSNLGRSFWIGETPYYDVIQIDAAINPGNSGGPLINNSGEVIGLSSAAATEAQNIGFAINVATAGHIFRDLVQYGKASHPYLGVDLTDYMHKPFEGQLAGPAAGAAISRVQSGSPADMAHIQPDDVIIRLDQEEVTSAADLMRALWRRQSKESINLTIVRRGQVIKINVTSGDRPSDSTLI